MWFRRYDYGDENVGVIGSGDGLLVVDTRATEVHAHALIADVRRLSDAPIEENSPPGYRDSYPLEWPETLRRVIDRVGGPVVPGHGEVIDRSFAKSFADQLDTVARLVRSVVGAERSPEEARADSPVHPRAFDQALGRVRAGD